MAIVRFFGPAREAAGASSEVVDGATVADVLEHVKERHGTAFTQVLDGSKVWVGGEPAALGDAVGASDEVAILPPVSGG